MISNQRKHEDSRRLFIEALQGGEGEASAGRWRVEYAAELEVTRAAAEVLDAFATLSTAASSSSQPGQ